MRAANVVDSWQLERWEFIYAGIEKGRDWDLGNWKRYKLTGRECARVTLGPMRATGCGSSAVACRYQVNGQYGDVLFPFIGVVSHVTFA